MARIVRCKQCQVALNLPESAAGKRLKCPKCGTKFTVESDLAGFSAIEPSDHDAGPDTSQDIPVNRPARRDEESLPTSAGDLRDTFDLPMMTGSAGAAAGAAKGQAADALALFEEKKPARRQTVAEARSKPRRCSCGSVVPVGMSLCATCGLDLDTGQRIGFDDEDLMPEAPVRRESMPIPVAVIGGISLLGSAILALASLVQCFKGVPGWVYFVPVCLFGVFASVQFLRRKSVKLLLVTHTLGAMIAVVALIALPVVQANMETIAEERILRADDDPTAQSIAIQPVSERLDTQKLTTGVVLLIVYAGVATYLLSASVRRHYRT